jgi:hypothetical protein
MHFALTYHESAKVELISCLGELGANNKGLDGLAFSATPYLGLRWKGSMQFAVGMWARAKK